MLECKWMLRSQKGSFVKKLRQSEYWIKYKMNKNVCWDVGNVNVFARMTMIGEKRTDSSEEYTAKHMAAYHLTTQKYDKK